MKKTILFLAILMAAMILLSMVALAAGMTAGDMADKMAGTYEICEGDITLPFKYKIERSGDDMKMSMFIEEGGDHEDTIAYNSTVKSVNDDGTEIVFGDGEGASVTMQLKPNGDIIMTSVNPDMTPNIILLKKIVPETNDPETDAPETNAPETGDTTNVLLLGAVMLIAAAGMMAAMKRAK